MTSTAGDQHGAGTAAPDVRRCISVVIPAHNAARTLAATLESLAASRDLIREIIVVDDSSDDGTAEVAQEAGRRHDLPVDVLRIEARDTGTTRNTGLDHAQGRYIYFIDADDLALAGGLEALLDALEGGTATIAVGATLRRTEGLPDKVKTVNGLGPDRAANAATLLKDKTWSIAVGAALVERRLAQSVRFPQGVGLDEETCYWAALATCGDFTVIDRTVLLYFLDLDRMARRYAADPRRHYLKLAAAYTSLIRYGLDRDPIRWRRAWIALRLARQLVFRGRHEAAADLLRLPSASRHFAGSWVLVRYLFRSRAGRLRQRLGLERPRT